MKTLVMCVLVVSAAGAQTPRSAGDPERVWRFFAESNDADRDGKVTKAEYSRGDEKFAAFDADGDGVITRADFVRPASRPAAPQRAAEGGRGREDKPSSRPQRGGPAPRAGDVAPDFELPVVGEKRTIRLSSFAGKRPVALIFGSWT